MTNKLITGMITIVIGLALLPVVNNFVTDLTGVGGTFADTTVGTLIDLLPILYVIVLVAGVVGYISYKRG